MSITTERLLNLVEAYETLELFYDNALGTVQNSRSILAKEILSQKQSGEVDLEHCLDAIHDAEGALSKYLNMPRELTKVLIKEKAHLEFTASKNKKAREALKRHRLKIRAQREMLDADYEINQTFARIEETDKTFIVREYEAPPDPRPAPIFEIDLAWTHAQLLQIQASSGEFLDSSIVADLWRKDGAPNEIAQKLVNAVLASGMAIDSGKRRKWSEFSIDPNWALKEEIES